LSDSCSLHTPGLGMQTTALNSWPVQLWLWAVLPTILVGPLVRFHQWPLWWSPYLRILLRNFEDTFDQLVL